MTNDQSVEAGDDRRSNWLWRVLWHRQFEHYPDNGPRYQNLALVIVVTITLYYQFYIAGAVAPSILRHFGISFTEFVNMMVVANAVGAFSSLLAGLADRWGRANMVVGGLGLASLLTLFGLPNAPDMWSFATIYAVIGFVQGIILVATPALVRDFSPQLGRASAMSFWTLGPVVGSLVVAEVSSHTLPVLPHWQDQFVIAGIVGLVVFAGALFGLRDLSPGLRDQLMVSLHDRALIDAKADKVDVKAALRHPWLEMLHFDIVGSALAIALFLLIYFTMVSFLVIYLTTTYGFSEVQAAALGNWFWAFDAVALLVVGFLSDWLDVRKPFMLLGALGTIALTILFLLTADHPATGWYLLAVILTLLAICLAAVFAPWMASFTETIERRNPAATAHGLAIWGWILRSVVAVAFFVLPLIVHSVTPLVEHGARVNDLETALANQLATIQEAPELFARLRQYPPGGAPPQLQQELAQKVGPTALADVENARPQLEYLRKYGPIVHQAENQAPGQWETWWWVCAAGQVVFLPLVFFMAGYWLPRKAHQEAEEHEREVDRQMDSLSGSRSSGGAAEF